MMQEARSFTLRKGFFRQWKKNRGGWSKGVENLRSGQSGYKSVTRNTPLPGMFYTVPQTSSGLPCENKQKIKNNRTSLPVWKLLISAEFRMPIVVRLKIPGGKEQGRGSAWPYLFSSTARRQQPTIKWIPFWNSRWSMVQVNEVSKFRKGRKTQWVRETLEVRGGGR